MSYTQRVTEKPCKFGCKKIVVWKGKTGEPNSTGYFELGTKIEHTFARCRDLKEHPEEPEQQQAPPEGQTTLPRSSGVHVSEVHHSPAAAASASSSSTQQQGTATIYSILSKQASLERETRELRREVQTLTGIVDMIAQNVTLLVAKIGYPEPEKLVKIAPGEAPPPPSHIIEGQQEAFHKTQEMIKQGLAQDEEKSGNSSSTSLTSSEWNIISEPFECHSCGTKTHNGYEKYNTKLCEECKKTIVDDGKLRLTNTNNTSNNNANTTSIEDIATADDII